MPKRRGVAVGIEAREIGMQLKAQCRACVPSGNSAMKPSAGTLSMLRPACVGTVCEVACARNVRPRSTVRSSSRSIAAIESLISATRMARAAAAR